MNKKITKTIAKGTITFMIGTCRCGVSDMSCAVWRRTLVGHEVWRQGGWRTSTRTEEYDICDMAFGSISQSSSLYCSCSVYSVAEHS